MMGYAPVDYSEVPRYSIKSDILINDYKIRSKTFYPKLRAHAFLNAHSRPCMYVRLLLDIMSLRSASWFPRRMYTAFGRVVLVKNSFYGVLHLFVPIADTV